MASAFLCIASTRSSYSKTRVVSLGFISSYCLKKNGHTFFFKKLAVYLFICPTLGVGRKHPLPKEIKMQTKKKWSFQLDGLRRHKLMTKVIAEKVPKLNETEDQGYQAEVVVKYFSPYTGYTFFVTEFDGDDVLFGYCLSPAFPDCDEWGYDSLRELAGLVVYGKVPAIERDMH